MGRWLNLSQLNTVMIIRFQRPIKFDVVDLAGNVIDMWRLGQLYRCTLGCSRIIFCVVHSKSRLRSSCSVLFMGDDYRKLDIWCRGKHVTKFS